MNVISTKDKTTVAKNFAQTAHAGQTRKDGKTDYFIGHVEEVVKLARILFHNLDIDKLNKLIQVCYLHDCIEDCEDGTEQKIKELFDSDVYDAVVLLTKKGNVDYNVYIDAIFISELARKAKICDMLHNMHDNSSVYNRKKYSNSLMLLWQKELGI